MRQACQTCASDSWIHANDIHIKAIQATGQQHDARICKSTSLKATLLVTFTLAFAEANCTFGPMFGLLPKSTTNC